MRPHRARWTALVAVIAATSAGAILLAPGASAEPCTSATGVTVVVEYGDPAAATIGCAGGDPATGLQALEGSGHRFTFVPRQPGFVCSIDARPDPCNNAPANAYWSYWHAQPGGSWSYGTAGAAAYHPAVGTIDGWSFGSGTPPRSRPPISTASGIASSKASAAGTATAGAATALGDQTPRSTTRTLPTDGGGSVGGLVAGITLVVLLGAAAGYVARRRSHLGN
ncbi:MAG: hypothetical protein ABI662_10170 [Dermatophilaceae bacterium]